MKNKLLAAVIVLVGVGLYVWMYQPQLLRGVTAAVQKADVTGGNARAAAQSAEQKASAWNAFYKPRAGCDSPTTSLKKLECDNDAQSQRARFEERWAKSAR